MKKIRAITIEESHIALTIFDEAANQVSNILLHDKAAVIVDEVERDEQGHRMKGEDGKDVYKKVVRREGSVKATEFLEAAGFEGGIKDFLEQLEAGINPKKIVAPVVEEIAPETEVETPVNKYASVEAEPEEKAETGEAEPVKEEVTEVHEETETLEVPAGSNVVVETPEPEKKTESENSEKAE